MIVLNATDTRAALPMVEAIEAMKWALSSWSSSAAIVPSRLHLELPDESGIGLVMPAFVPPLGSGEAAYAVKTLSGMTANPGLGLPLFQGATVLFDPKTGRAMAVIDAGALTAIRTGACAAVATDLLARPEASILAVIGAGAQGRAMVEAVCSIRDIKDIRVYDRHPARAQAVSVAYSAFGLATKPMTNSSDAVRGAEIICTATPASEPVFDPKDVSAGAHINAIGSFRPDMREIPGPTMLKARVFADNASGAMSESGDIVQALREGLITMDHVVGEIGEILTARLRGRESDDQITLYESVGQASQDAVAALAAYRNAVVKGIGQVVAW